MQLQKNSKLFIRDVYSYDIRSCHYVILQRLGHDMTTIEKDDKLKRNTQIGLLMRDNPRLTNVVRSITDSTINEYLLRNKVQEEELII